MSIFRSTIRNLRVSFPPEQFGLGEDIEGNPAPYKPIKLIDGAYRTGNEKQVSFMRKHSGNKANGGSDFWEENTKDSEVLEGAMSAAKAFFPVEGITEQDNNQLKFLAKCCESFSPNQKAEVVQTLCDIMDRFEIIGLKKPETDMKIVRLKGRVIEIMGLLEDSNYIDMKKL